MLFEGEAKVKWPPYREGIFRPKKKVGNSIVYNRIYYRGIYLREGWVRVKEMTQQM